MLYQWVFISWSIFPFIITRFVLIISTISKKMFFFGFLLILSSIRSRANIFVNIKWRNIHEWSLPSIILDKNILEQRTAILHRVEITTARRVENAQYHGILYSGGTARNCSRICSLFTPQRDLYRRSQSEAFLQSQKNSLIHHRSLRHLVFVAKGLKAPPTAQVFDGEDCIFYRLWATSETNVMTQIFYLS